jgi:hypothetical protein
MLGREMPEEGIFDMWSNSTRKFIDVRQEHVCDGVISDPNCRCR